MEKRNEIKKSGASAYRRTEVLTANRETILLMLYAGAIRSLKKALDFQASGKSFDRLQSVIKAQEIVSELRSTLDFEHGGDIAVNLEKLYAYVTECLIKANAQGDSDAIKQALSVLETLNAAWETAIASLKKSAGASK